MWLMLVLWAGVPGQATTASPLSDEELLLAVVAPDPAVKVVGTESCFGARQLVCAPWTLQEDNARESLALLAPIVLSVLAGSLDACAMLGCKVSWRSGTRSSTPVCALDLTDARGRRPPVRSAALGNDWGMVVVCGMVELLLLRLDGC